MLKSHTQVNSVKIWSVKITHLITFYYRLIKLHKLVTF